MSMAWVSDKGRLGRAIKKNDRELTPVNASDCSDLKPSTNTVIFSKISYCILKNLAHMIDNYIITTKKYQNVGD
jgi:hypothetical protein